jgi:dolichol-phosphate mannosyltransferase/undecaprenyl-phosphate 4-deoxy-4-formamido-L-arabinose transferase
MAGRITPPHPEKGRLILLVSIVIPVFNSTDTLVELAVRIAEVFSKRPDDEYELIFVDDSSTLPETWPTLQRLAEEDPKIGVVQLTRNFGQQAATLCGLRESRGDVVITMDDDLQHVPEDIPKFLESSGYDVVVGQFNRKRHGLLKRTASRIKGLFDRIIVGKPKHIQLSAYRMLSRTVVDGILSIRTPNPFLPALIFHISKNVVGVEVRHSARDAGKSGYTLWKLLRLFNTLLVNNSSLLLRVVGYLGVTIAVVSFGFSGALVYRKLVFGIPVQGWASLLGATLLIGGLLLFSMGVVGEYLIRIIESSECRPTYFIRLKEGLAGEPGRTAAATDRGNPSETRAARGIERDRFHDVTGRS